ncbi:AAA family ATPase [bacterium]|nr:AAA family ATPase [bacterium]MBP5435949.1 AAA family ATPase [bacterium]
MTTKDARSLVNRLVAEQYSQAAIAALCGVSASALSTYLNGTYAAKDKTALEKKIISGCRTEIERIDKNIDPVLPYIETETANIIQDLAHLCHTTRRMGLIYGPAGVGKTRACLEYCRQHSNALYIEARPSFTARTLMRSLAQALGCTPKTNQYELEEEVIRKLRGSGRLIIVDECEHLNHRALETLRTVVFNAAHTGLLLVGLETLKYALIGTRTKNEYLSSRCLANSRVTALTASETKRIIEGFFKDPLTTVKEAFYSVSKGNMRLLENTIFEVKRLLQINPDAKLDKEFVFFAAEQSVLR